MWHLDLYQISHTRRQHSICNTNTSMHHHRHQTSAIARRLDRTMVHLLVMKRYPAVITTCWWGIERCCDWISNAYSSCCDRSWVPQQPSRDLGYNDSLQAFTDWSWCRLTKIEHHKPYNGRGDRRSYFSSFGHAAGKWRIIGKYTLRSGGLRQHEGYVL